MLAVHLTLLVRGDIRRVSRHLNLRVSACPSDRDDSDFDIVEVASHTWFDTLECCIHLA